MILSSHDSVATGEMFRVLMETKPARFGEHGTGLTVNLTPPSLPQIRGIRAIRGAWPVRLLAADFPDCVDVARQNDTFIPIRGIRAIRGLFSVLILTADFPDGADSPPIAMSMANQAMETQILSEPVAADGDSRV